MQICEAKTNLANVIRLIADRKIHPIHSEEIKIKINIILSMFTPNIITGLKKKLEKRHKKRRRQCRARKEFKLKNEELAKMKQKEIADVDRLFRCHQEQESRAKTEESVRRQADVVLHSVTRHKLEGRRVISLLTALSKLRAGRCQQDAAAGATPSQCVTEAFEMAMDKLRALWGKQLDEYAVEEAGLKVMLAEGSASRLGQVEREVNEILHDWQIAMFGEQTPVELTWEQLVDVRQQWDKFVVSPDMLLSSGIPSGWVIPQALPHSWRPFVSFEEQQSDPSAF